MIFALRTGASAYFVKDVLPDELIAAIRSVRAASSWCMARRCPIRRKLMQWLLAWYNERAHFDGDDQGTLMPLSTREMEVLELIVRGASNKMIASSLGHQPADGQEPHEQHLPQAGGQRSHGGRHGRPAAGLDPPARCRCSVE